MEPLTREEALVGVALCAAYADGSMGAEENDELTDALATCHALSRLDEGALRQAMMKVERIARREGESALLAQAATALPDALRPTAFYLGVSLVVADDEMAKEERDFIERLRRALGVAEPEAGRILDVARIRNMA